MSTNLEKIRSSQLLSDSVQSRYEAVIGLEVHVQLNTKTKLFCSCSATFGEDPNHNTCAVCLGMPGALPVLNSQVVDYGIAMALAIKAQVASQSVFARKQYFYPDLPKGYQITQYDLPYCVNGEITLSCGQTVRVTRIHFEEDAGKSVHSEGGSFVDLNRAGTPLLEMVSEPDLRTPEEAADYLKKVHAIVKFLGISDGNMEEGSFRCDANVSIRKRGESTLGTRAEIKNVNSFRNVERAIAYEIHRQADLIDSGEQVVQQTLKFDASSGKTSPIRSKEETADYRYFPDPDLGILEIALDRIDRIRTELPELPEDVARRFMEEFDLTSDDAMVLIQEREIALFFEETLKSAKGITPKKVANFLITEYLREARERQWSLDKPFVSSENLGSLLSYVGTGTISGKIAKQVFSEMAESGKSPTQIIEGKGLVQISDDDEITASVNQVLEKNPAQVEGYLAGKEKLLGFFVGQVMKLSGGKYNPGVVNKILKERLNAQRK